ncbi:MAG: methyltransferase domain-containing protein, partial [Chloroflexota bacterium]
MENHIQTSPQPLDFAATWADYARHNNRERATNAGEVAFWEQHAHGYDAGIQREPESYIETLNAIRAYHRPDDTLLDVGAGSGRFALPLAQSVEQVTALDLSPDMLEILKRHAAAQNITNIHTVQGNWEDTPAELHDMV